MRVEFTMCKALGLATAILATTAPGTHAGGRTRAHRATAAMMLALAIASVIPDAAAAMPAAISAWPDSTRAAAADTTATAAPAGTTTTDAAADTVAATTIAAAADTAAGNAAVAPSPSPPPASAYGPGPARIEALRNRLASARHLRLQTRYRTFDLWQLQLTPDSVRFRIADDQAGDVIRALAWRDVYGIQVHGNHRGTGAKMGAIVVGAGAALLLTSMAVDARWDFSLTEGWAPLLITGGVLLTLAGALTGALAGNFVTKWENVYP